MSFCIKYNNRIPQSGKTTEVLVKLLHNKDAIALVGSNSIFTSDMLNKRVFSAYWDDNVPQDMVEQFPDLSEENKLKNKEKFFEVLKGSNWLLVDDAYSLSLKTKKEIIDFCKQNDIGIYVYYSDVRLYTAQREAWEVLCEKLGMRDKHEALDNKVKMPNSKEWIKLLTGVDTDTIITDKEYLWENYDPQFEEYEPSKDDSLKS